MEVDNPFFHVKFLKMDLRKVLDFFGTNCKIS